MYARATVCLGTVLATCLLLVLQAPSGTAAVNVVELTDDNFDNHTASGVWLIKIYAPWCSHCRQLEPLWVALGEDAESEGLKIGKVGITA